MAGIGGAAPRDAEIRLPKTMKVKNKAPAQRQITAEQLLREAKEIQLEDDFKAPKTIITDPEELAEYRWGPVACVRVGGVCGRCVHDAATITSTSISSSRQQQRTNAGVGARASLLQQHPPSARLSLLQQWPLLAPPHHAPPP
jgi:hypothetical protein